MTEMRARVARAITARRLDIVSADPALFAEELADAAISAMREPTDKMIDAGEWEAGSTKAIWQAMIDVERNEK